MDTPDSTRPSPQIIDNNCKGTMDTLPRWRSNTIKQCTNKAVTTKPNPKDKNQHSLISQALSGEPFQHQMPASPSCIRIWANRRHIILYLKPRFLRRLMNKPKSIKAVTSAENKSRLTFRYVIWLKSGMLHLLTAAWEILHYLWLLINTYIFILQYQQIFFNRQKTRNIALGILYGSSIDRTLLFHLCDTFMNI